MWQFKEKWTAHTHIHFPWKPPRKIAIFLNNHSITGCRLQQLCPSRNLFHWWLRTIKASRRLSSINQNPYSIVQLLKPVVVNLVVPQRMCHLIIGTILSPKDKMAQLMLISDSFPSDALPQFASSLLNQEAAQDQRYKKRAGFYATLWPRCSCPGVPMGSCCLYHSHQRLSMT